MLYFDRFVKAMIVDATGFDMNFFAFSDYDGPNLDFCWIFDYMVVRWTCHTQYQTDDRVYTQQIWPYSKCFDL